MKRRSPAAKPGFFFDGRKASNTINAYATVAAESGNYTCLTRSSFGIENVTFSGRPSSSSIPLAPHSRN